MGRLKQINRKTRQDAEYWQGRGFFVPPLGHFWDRHSTAICKLKEIDWQNINWQVIGNDINTNSNLRHISLQGYKFSDEVILGNMFNTNTPSLECPIQSISLTYCCIRPGGIDTFLPWLNAVSPTLSVLKLDSNSLGDIGAITLSELLQITSLEHLSLRHNGIGDSGVNSLLDKMYSSRLQVLDIGGNSALTERGVITMKNYSNQETSLKVLHLSISSEDDIAKRLIRSLHNMSSLKKLCLDCPDLERFNEHDGKMQVLQEALFNLVCDPSSFDSLVKSNHTITEVNVGREVVNKNCKALAINNHDISEVMKMREKIVKYFVVGRFDLQPFLELDVELMPYVIEMIGMKHEEFQSVTNGSKQWFNVPSGNLNGIYRLVRFVHMPEMLSFISPEKKIMQLEEEVKQLTLYCERLERRGVDTKRMKKGE